MGPTKSTTDTDLWDLPEPDENDPFWKKLINSTFIACHEVNTDVTKDNIVVQIGRVQIGDILVSIQYDNLIKIVNPLLKQPYEMKILEVGDKLDKLEIIFNEVDCLSEPGRLLSEEQVFNFLKSMFEL